MNNKTVGTAIPSVADASIIINSPLGNELTEEQCQTLTQSVRLFCLRDGDVLIEEGHKNDDLFIVVDGTLEVSKSVGGGEHITLQLLRKGDMAGELGFIDELPHTADLRAIGDCEVLALSRADLEGFLTTDPEIVYRVMRAIIRTVHGILRRMNMQYVEMTNYISKTHGRY
ncbi:MAG TPA: cyclic nucleotide-binding domain-containing protein [Sedimenticola sp.]|nr:cyclic nucleotide-binding domain-containing protein [Sedimenticola sp.]